MLKSIINLIVILLFLSTTFGCGKKSESIDNIKYSSLKEVPETKLEDLSKKLFFFGHQSVGDNIIEGIKDIMVEYPKLNLNIIESISSRSFKPGTFAHSKVGENTKPESKIHDFERILGSGIGKEVNAAAIKLCYIDFSETTDTKKLFSKYVDSIDKIKKNYPDITIIHFTAPLTTVQSGIKAWINNLIGRPIYGSIENKKRYEYNALLRLKYQGIEPILDIARIESSYDDGSRSSFKSDGKTYYSLAPEYTDDGGHLNKTGRKKVAEQLILTLANM